MNLSALPELLLSWVKNQGVALLQGDKAQPSAFQPGQQYEGKVVDNLASGRQLVKVGAQLLDMNLPGKTQAGDSVRLTFLNGGARPTFLLNQAPVTPIQQVQISNTAQQVNALLRLAQAPAVSAPAATSVAMTSSATTAARSAAASVPGTLPDVKPATPDVASISATASSAAKLVASQTASPAASVVANAGAASAQATGVRGTTSATVVQPTLAKPTGQPSAATPSTATSSAAAAAAGAVTGVTARPIVANVLLLQNFNASVQSMTTTLTGPNTGLLGQAVDATRATVAASTTLSPNTLVELPSPTRHLLPVRLSQTVSESGLFYESHLAKWNRGTQSIESILREPQARLSQESQVASRLAELDGMPEVAARMAGRQLQMLEGAPFLWQGLAWPGQTMEWLVREGGDGEGQGEADETASEWNTELNLTLPRLGQVHAALGLAGDQLRLRLVADSARTRDQLEAALPLLVKGLEANGLHAIDPAIAAPPPAGEHEQA